MAPTRAQMARHAEIRKEWRTFRAEHIFSQKQLAEKLGISRRAVQYTEQAKPERACIPGPNTLSRFHALKVIKERESYGGNDIEGAVERQ